MADNISIRGGDKEGMPDLRDRELAFVRDEEALYIGTPDGNLKLCSAEMEGKVNSLEEASASHSEDIERIDEELSGIDETLGAVGEAMESIGEEMDSLSKDKLSASAAASVSAVAVDAEAADIAAKVNELISALKASGIMST